MPAPPVAHDPRRFDTGLATGGRVNIYDNGSISPTIVGAPSGAFGFTDRTAVAV
jgi:hypothetical protein